MKNGMIIMIIHNMMRPAAERIEFVCNRMACTKRSLVWWYCYQCPIACSN